MSQVGSVAESPAAVSIATAVGATVAQLSPNTSAARRATSVWLMSTAALSPAFAVVAGLACCTADATTVVERVESPASGGVIATTGDGVGSGAGSVCTAGADGPLHP